MPTPFCREDEALFWLMSTDTKNPGRTNSILTVAVMLVLIGFSWRSCWYATKLSDSQMEKLLSGDGSDGQVHKALSQFVDRVEQKDAKTEDWYDEVLGLAKHKTSQIRSTAAWAMGCVPEHAPFVGALTPLLDDESLQVRYNAAVSLGASKQESARPMLRMMLDSHAIPSPLSGTMEEPRAQNEYVRSGQILGRLKRADGSKLNIIAPLDGRIAKVVKRHGVAVSEGDELFVLEPNEGQLGNAMIALARCGTKDDIPILTKIKNGRFNSSATIQELAAKAITALEKQ
ncbi:MAG: biotin carboxyl carrier protein [Planctomycetota bacterium]|jgi:biotin carboxyl carrier protein